MGSWRRTGFVIFVSTFALLVVVSALPGTSDMHAAPAVQDMARGQAIYEQRCAVCHGSDGNGQGPTAEYLFVKPRDFTRDEYEIKSTAGDEFPSREDLITVITNGMPGSSMPGWRGVLSQADIAAVADYVQTFGRFFSQEGYGTTKIEIPRRIRPSAESIARGRELYVGQIECVRCHGNAGRGDGPSAPELTDNAGHVIYPADLTQPWRFRGGGRPEDIYLRLHTGMSGSPMPSFADSLSEEDTWHLVNYVLSLSPEAAPEPAVLIESRYVDGPLPAGLDDPAWAELEPAYYPLAGQIMRSPRHYQPSINAVMVRSMYNEAEVAFFVTWNDRTESREGAAVDALVIQFPQALAAGDERPYFVFGDATRAVYQWYWSADTGQVRERIANGPDVIQEQDESQRQTTVSARYQDGQWQALFRRPLRSGVEGILAFETDRFIPIAFMVWDGSAGESGLRLGLTTWSRLFLPRPTPLIRYGWIPVVMLGVVAAESLLMWRLRRPGAGKTD